MGILKNVGKIVLVGASAFTGYKLFKVCADKSTCLSLRRHVKALIEDPGEFMESIRNYVDFVIWKHDTLKEFGDEINYMDEAGDLYTDLEPGMFYVDADYMLHHHYGCPGKSKCIRLHDVGSCTGCMLEDWLDVDEDPRDPLDVTTQMIIETFEELLEEKDMSITCSSESEEEDRTNDDEPARIYGSEYYELFDEVKNILKFAISTIKDTNSKESGKDEK